MTHSGIAWHEMWEQPAILLMVGVILLIVAHHIEFPMRLIPGWATAWARIENSLDYYFEGSSPSYRSGQALSEFLLLTIGWTCIAVGAGLVANKTHVDQQTTTYTHSHLLAWGIVPCVAIWFLSSLPKIWGESLNLSFVSFSLTAAAGIAVSWVFLGLFASIDRDHSVKYFAWVGGGLAALGETLIQGNKGRARYHHYFGRALGSITFIGGAVLWFLATAFKIEETF